MTWTLQRGFWTPVAGVTPIQPDAVAGLEVWLKADAITGLVDGDPVTTWTDSSGLGNNATQATASKKPTYKTNIVNGKPVVRFDGTDDEMATAALAGGSATQPTTVFAVFKSNANSKPVFDGDTERQQFVFGTSYIYSGTVLTGSVWALTTWLYASCVFNGTSSQFWKNGVSDASGNAGTQSLDLLVIGSDVPAGGNAYFNGDIPEVFMYDALVSNANRQGLEAYMADKYAI